MDYLQESKCPMGHFASHAYGSLGMPEEATRHSYEDVSIFLYKLFHSEGNFWSSLVPDHYQIIPQQISPGWSDK